MRARARAGEASASGVGNLLRVGASAKGSPVRAKAVPLIGDDLRREILGRAAQREGAVAHHLGEAEVDELQVAVAVEE